MVVLRTDEGAVRSPSASIVPASEISDLPISASGYRHFTIVPINVTGSSADALADMIVAHNKANDIETTGQICCTSNLLCGPSAALHSGQVAGRRREMVPQNELGFDMVADHSCEARRLVYNPLL